MVHRYIVLDGEIYGTGIRDQYTGFFDPKELPLSDVLVQKISTWKDKCHSIHGIISDWPEATFHKLDLEGLEILKNLRDELGQQFKIRYVSFLTGKEIILKPNGEYVMPQN